MVKYEEDKLPVGLSVRTPGGRLSSSLPAPSTGEYSSVAGYRDFVRIQLEDGLVGVKFGHCN